MSQPQGGPYGGAPRGSASFDVQKIMPGGLIAFVGGLLFFVFSFFPWYTLDFCGGLNEYGFTCSVSANAWDRGIATFSVIVFLLASIAFLVKALQVVPPKLPLEMIALGLVVLGDIFFLISLFSTHGLSRGWALWVCLVLAIVINVGAVLQFMRAGGIASAQRSLGSAPGAVPPPAYGAPSGYPQQGYPPQQPPQRPQQPPGYPQQGNPRQRPQQPPGHPPQGPA